MKVTIKDGQANVAAEFRRDMMDIQHKPGLTGNQPQPNKAESNGENKKQKRTRLLL